MPVLTLGRSDQFRAVCRESHALWGSGLSPGDYIGLWHDLKRTAWGSRHAGFYVWADRRGEVLSSVKLYRPRLRLAGQTSRATVIAALFTPRARRGRGHASELVRAVLERARGRGDRLALLFSDIGAEFYAALGFRALPAVSDRAVLPVDPPAQPEGTLQPMSDADLPDVRAAHDAFCRTRPIAVVRDEDHWRFLETRSDRFFRRLDHGPIRTRREVARSRGRFVGYLVTVEERSEWHVREVGAAGGAPEAMATVLRLGAARARRSGRRELYGWLPPCVKPALGDWEIRTRPRRRAVPMLLALEPSLDLRALSTADAAYLPFLDQF